MSLFCCHLKLQIGSAFQVLSEHFQRQLSEEKLISQQSVQVINM